MKWRRTISLGLAAAMTASTVLAGCGGDSGAAPESWVISFFWTMQIIWTA